MSDIPQREFPLDVGHLPGAKHLPVSSQTLVQSFVAPPGKVCLLYGDNLIFQLSLRMAAHAMAQGRPIAVVDGCNRFNVHLLSRFARERHIDPDEFLHRIFISRGFTCYQMEQAVSSRLPVFLESIGSNIAMIFGLLDTFYDEQASFREVQQILRRLLGTLQDIKAGGVSVLLACTEWNVLPKERNQLFTTLKTGMDTIYRLAVDHDNRPSLFLEAGVINEQHTLLKQPPKKDVTMESLSPNIFVRDIDETIVWYKTLGFDLVMTVPETGDYVWAMMTCGSVSFMFQTFASLGDALPEVSRNSGGSLLLYIKLKNIRTFFDSIKDRVTVVRGLEKTFYGATEFSIKDNNGYVLTFAEDEK